MLTTVLALLLAFAPAGMSPEAAKRRAQEHHREGQQLMTEEKFEQAVKAFQKAVEFDPLLFMAFYNLGQSHMALKQYPQAVTAYQGAKDAVLRINQLGSQESAERYRAGKDEINDLRRTIADVRTGVAKVAQPEMLIVRLEERLRVLEGMQMGTSDMTRVPAEVNLALGSAYFRQNMMPEAEKAYVAAVKDNNKLGAAHNNLTVIYMLTGRFKEARASLKSAEKAGFKVSPQLKADLDKREAAAAAN
jgi:tetratricopeptide (TPR) repeat protein